MMKILRQHFNSKNTLYLSGNNDNKFNNVIHWIWDNLGIIIQKNDFHI